MADDADRCGLAAESYDTWNWHNDGKNTPLKIAAHPNLTQYRKVIVFCCYTQSHGGIIRRNIPIGFEKFEKKISKIK